MPLARLLLKSCTGLAALWPLTTGTKVRFQLPHQHMVSATVVIVTVLAALAEVVQEAAAAARYTEQAEAAAAALGHRGVVAAEGVAETARQAAQVE